MKKKIYLIFVILSILNKVYSKEYGLVLSGGGGKGAYEAGVWFALTEYGIAQKTTIISGASVGGLNAALFVCENNELIYNLWIDSVPKYLTNEYEFISQDGLFQMLKNIPLEKLTNQTYPYIYIDALTSDTIFFKELQYFNLNHEVRDEIENRLLATSAFPFLCNPILLSDGKKYEDGGNNLLGGDNVPLSPIMNRNDVMHSIDTIFVVDMSSNLLRKYYEDDEIDIIYIEPSEYIGGLIFGTLNFNKDKIKYLIDLGYCDAVQVLKEKGYYPVLNYWFE